MADDPDARHACPRYHGPADAYFRRRAAEVSSPSVMQGRGRCDDCGHQVFFDPLVPLRYPQLKKRCLVCILDHLDDLDERTRVEAVLAAEEHPVACPTNPCAYASGT